MPMPPEDLEAEALRLPAPERGRLAARLLESLDADPGDTPESIAKAWDEEIARRVADMDAGLTESIPYEQVRKELRAMIDARSTKR